MNIFRLPQRIPRTHPLATLSRPFTLTALRSKNLPPRPKPPPDTEIEESFLKGSGPGGQKINKTNSAVQLKHVPTGIVVKSQATRSRSQNRKHARELLAQKVDDLLHGEQSRSSIVGQVKKKKAASAAKKSRRKYRKLDEEREAAGEEEGPEHSPRESEGSGQVQGETTIEEPKHPQENNKRP
ncbi:hypothetical protein H634G_10648 [Metarhizium anisopliae BRIP 53293]|uniref:Prokaryotic-type class I peptide chain release factors domain-containing protein n=1 Tax=Metarhizium anisopliae BRIP 53293 TaxID=1291518 RepID=A0A0D9NJI6_METAN|nr:hypothetical protein H634G_10648 [Metarhizium anisopliae BRIP 53293]